MSIHKTYHIIYLIKIKFNNTKLLSKKRELKIIKFSKGKHIMNTTYKTLKLIILFTSIIVFTTSIQAIDLQLAGEITIIQNHSSEYTTCRKDDTYRLNTNENIDIILTIVGDHNDYDDDDRNRSCIFLLKDENSPFYYLEFKLKNWKEHNEVGETTEGASLDLRFDLVKKNTNTIIEVDNFHFTVQDLDTWEGCDTDDIYVKSPAKAFRDSNESLVSYEDQNFSFGDITYNGKLKGFTEGNCRRTATQVDKKRCSGAGMVLGNIRHLVSQMDIRIANDKAYPDRVAPRAFQISFNNADTPNYGKDHGDAPQIYGDAFHDINLSIILGNGTFADHEEEALYSENADGDDNNNQDSSTIDDEDALVKVNNKEINGSTFALNIGEENNLSIAYAIENGKKGFLSGWIDYNKDGTFDDENEKIIDDLTVQDINNSDIKIIVADDISIGTTYARFRLSNEREILSIGNGKQGEVEDYKVTLSPHTPLGFTISNAHIKEGEGNLTFNIELNRTSNIDTVISLSTAEKNATAGVDYNATPKPISVTIPAKHTQAQVEVEVFSDTIQENVEGMYLKGEIIQGANIGYETNGTGTIEDNTTPQLTISEASAKEGETMTFNVQVTPANYERTLTVSTQGGQADGQATEGQDYRLLTTEIQIGKNINTVAIQVEALEDNITESNETFTLKGNIGELKASAIGTIKDNTTPTFNVQVTPTNYKRTLTVSTQGGQADGQATEGQDYRLLTTEIQIGKNINTVDIRVEALEDNIENNEIFTLNENIGELEASAISTIEDNTVIEPTLL